MEIFADTKQTLVDILKKETETLRIKYLEMTEKWAHEQCARNISRKNEYAKMTAKSIDTLGKNRYYAEQKFYYNTPAWHFKPEVFVPKMIENAEIHYLSSIEKLAYRIQAKQLNENNLCVKTSHIGVNIDTIITDGVKTVRAFTIIASGDIQKPHYRYLIK